MKSWQPNDSPLLTKEGQGEVPIPASGTETTANGADKTVAPAAARTDEPLLLAHLERDLLLIRRYEFVHSNLPWKSGARPIAAVLNGARWILRGALSFAMGTQDEFNAAVARVLLEFTRRAATRNPLTLNESALDEAMRILSARPHPDAEAEALELIARQVQLLREQVRAAQLSAAESERLQSELLRRIAALEAGVPRRPDQSRGSSHRSEEDEGSLPGPSRDSSLRSE